MSRVASRCSALIFAGLVAGIGPIAAETSEPSRSDPLQSYGELVLRYAKGEQVTTAQAARRLTADDLRGIIERVREIQALAAKSPKAACLVPWCDQCSYIDAWKRFPLLAAIMLHVDAAWPPSVPAWLTSSSENGPNRDQLGVIPVLLDMMLERDGKASPTAQAWHAIGARLLADANLEGVRSWTQLAVKRFPSDPQLLLLAGTIKETAGSMRITPMPATDGHGKAMVLRLQAAQELRAELQSAEGLFQGALQAQPDLAEARLRLGRVCWLMRKHAEAEAHLRQVLAQPAPEDIRYLAHLFVGRLHQDADRFDDAATAYQAALEIRPQAQSAFIGLSFALYRSGDEAASRDAIERSLATDRRRQLGDPFSSYHWGLPRGIDEVFDSLREQAKLGAQR